MICLKTKILNIIIEGGHVKYKNIQNEYDCIKTKLRNYAFVENVDSRSLNFFKKQRIKQIKKIMKCINKSSNTYKSKKHTYS